jgi:hypothetical protein
MSMTYAELSSAEAPAYGGLVDAIGGIATAVLAIVALTGFAPGTTAAIATIVFGAALLIQGGTILSEYAHLVFPADAALPPVQRFGGRWFISIVSGWYRWHRAGRARLAGNCFRAPNRDRYNRLRQRLDNEQQFRQAVVSASDGNEEGGRLSPGQRFPRGRSGIWLGQCSGCGRPGGDRAGNFGGRRNQLNPCGSGSATRAGRNDNSHREHLEWTRVRLDATDLEGNLRT